MYRQMSSLLWDCTFKDTTESEEQNSGHWPSIKRKKSLSTGKSSGVKHKTSLKKNCVNSRSLNKLIKTHQSLITHRPHYENECTSRPISQAAKPFAVMPKPQQDIPSSMIIYRINSEAGLSNNQRSISNVICFKGRKHVHNLKPTVLVEQKQNKFNVIQEKEKPKMGAIATLKQNMIRPLAKRDNEWLSEKEKKSEHFTNLLKITTLDELMGKNSIKVSLNPSEQSNEMSRVIATHNQMVNGNGWLPGSLTSNAQMTQSFLLPK